MLTSSEVTKLLIRLLRDARVLQHQAAAHQQIDSLSSKIQTYQNYLRIIYHKANSEQFDLAPYCNTLAEIETILQLIKKDEAAPSSIERTALFIDAPNLSKTSQKWLSNDIDYQKLLTYFAQNKKLLKAYYYVGVDNEHQWKSNKFYYALDQMGYQLVIKQIKVLPNGERKGNLDVELAIDMLELAHKVDSVVLFSGDGDFAPLLKKMGSKGVMTYVFSVWQDGEGSTAGELIRAADKFTELKELIPFISKSN